MLHGMDAYEVSQWMVYEKLYGRIGPERDDYLAARIAQTVYNSRVEKKSQAKPLDLFLLDWNPPQPLDEEDASADGQHP